MKAKLVALVIGFIVMMTSASVVWAQSGESAREQAEARLRTAAVFYEIELNQSQINLIESNCRMAQTRISSVREQLSSKEIAYLEAIESIDQNIKFTGNALRQMNEDSSNLEVAAFHLEQSKADFVSAVTSYRRSLSDLILVDCQEFPDLFSAGLEDARQRQKLVESAALALRNFVDKELAGVMEAVGERLKEIEVRL